MNKLLFIIFFFLLSIRDKPKSISKHKGILQIALAVALAFKNSLDQFSATEKALMQYLTVSPEEVLCNITQMVAEREEM